MYEKIVVPLDGSKLAECVLPHVEELAKSCNTKEVVLVTVTERIATYTHLTQRPQPVGPLPPPEPVIKVSMAVGKKQRQGQRYLNRIAKGLQKKGIKVRAEVLLGHPAEEIASFAEHDGADLIVIASHGRSGPSRWAYGSVADKVFRASCIPVLMVRAPGCVPGI
jgi:nucleotide-binding universal stress UspA family protein